MPISEEQFKKYINELSDSYEKIKDIAQAGDYFMTKETQAMLKEVSNFRDIACTALRAAHTTNNFNQN